ncbi:hypothetical protein PFISCL1PPCAC_9588, partial [Pristionchus fissidentatus]
LVKMRPSTVLRVASSIPKPQRAAPSAVQEAFLDADNCILVDEQDRIVGGATKRVAHHKSSVLLHRAFSIFAFTPDHELILQKRSDTKVTFPSLWTNTCCSHPLTGMPRDETDGVGGVLRAAVRKLDHELNLGGVAEDELLFMGRYLYKAAPPELEWIEHELDYALILKGVNRARVSTPNDDEVSQIRCVSERDLQQWMEKEPGSFTPWLRHFAGIGVLSKWWAQLGSNQKLREMSTEEIVRMN